MRLPTFQLARFHKRGEGKKSHATVNGIGRFTNSLKGARELSQDAMGGLQDSNGKL